MPEGDAKTFGTKRPSRVHEGDRRPNAVDERLVLHRLRFTNPFPSLRPRLRPGVFFLGGGARGEGAGCAVIPRSNVVNIAGFILSQRSIAETI